MKSFIFNKFDNRGLSIKQFLVWKNRYRFDGAIC